MHVDIKQIWSLSYCARNIYIVADDSYFIQKKFFSKFFCLNEQQDTKIHGCRVRKLVNTKLNHDKNEDVKKWLIIQKQNKK